MHRRCRLLKPPDKIRPVADHQRPCLGHAHIEVLQRLQKGGVLRPVPEDAGLVLIQAVVLRQRLGIPGAQLADGAVQKAPPGGGPLPDEEQVLRTEEHCVQNAGQLPRGLQTDPIGGQLPPPAPGQPGLQQEFPPAALHRAPNQGVLSVQPDHLPVIPARWDRAEER